MIEEELKALYEKHYQLHGRYPEYLLCSNDAYASISELLHTDFDTGTDLKYLSSTVLVAHVTRFEFTDNLMSYHPT